MRYLALILLLGCSGVQPPPIPIEPDDTHNCAAACQVLGVLGCEEGKPLEDGTTCTEFCEATQKAGHALNPTCYMRMTDCSQMEVCDRGRRKP